MKKRGNHYSKARRFYLISVLTLLSFVGFTQTLPKSSDTPVVENKGDAKLGETLFNTNCAACHKLDDQLIGPPLRNVATKYDRDWLHKWVKNSADLIKSGDATAKKVFEAGNKIPMLAFPQFTNEDIDNILAYTSQKKVEVAVVVAPVVVEDKLSDNVIIGFLTSVLVMLIIVMLMTIKTLRTIAKYKGFDDVSKSFSDVVWKGFVKYPVLVYSTSIFLILVGSYMLFAYLSQIGVDQGYQPIQPIHFSHRIHAGSNGVDCNYCHSAARVSRTAGIPSLNVCMNCHKNISAVSDTTATAEYSKVFYDDEIQKLYKAVGWDKTTQTYTGKTEPVKWVRIHNLQSFVYFNHSQHVTTGQIVCQKCHGPVQTYEVQKQFAPMTMGWCIDCHRTTGVKMKDNKYYTKIHEQLSKKHNIDTLTVAQAGGLECGKCHY